MSDMADEIDLNDEEEAALDAVWAARVKKKKPPEPVVDEGPETDEYIEEPSDTPDVKPSPFLKD